jgi:hypothetical protein
MDIRRLLISSGCTLEEVINSLFHGAATEITSNDIDGAVGWIKRYGIDVFDCGPQEDANFRQSLQNMVYFDKPSWVRLAPRGREFFLNGLSPEIAQSFRLAELTTNTSSIVVTWWDSIISFARAALDDRKVELGRLAERRTFERELQVLSDTDVQPNWVSIENNNAGYDISTWRFTDHAHLVKHYIEVKSSTSGPRFYLSRGEFKFASENKDRWNVDFWLGDLPHAFVITFDQIESMIPIDTPSSKWLEAEVNLDGLL